MRFLVALMVIGGAGVSQAQNLSESMGGESDREAQLEAVLKDHLEDLPNNVEMANRKDIVRKRGNIQALSSASGSESWMSFIYGELLEPVARSNNRWGAHDQESSGGVEGGPSAGSGFGAAGTSANAPNRAPSTRISCTMNFFTPSIGMDGHVEVRGSTNCPAEYDADIGFSYSATVESIYADSPSTRSVQISVFASGRRNGPIQGTPRSFKWRSDFGGMQGGRVSSVTSRFCECYRPPASAKGSN